MHPCSSSTNSSKENTNGFNRRTSLEQHIGSTAALLQLHPRSVTTTVVTTTTTTLTQLPPIVFPQPPPLAAVQKQEASRVHQKSFYPLADTPTPPAFKKFCFDLGGHPAHFSEVDKESLELQNSLKDHTSETTTHQTSSDPSIVNTLHQRQHQKLVSTASPLASVKTSFESSTTPSVTKTSRKRPYPVEESDSVEMLSTSQEVAADIKKSETLPGQIDTQKSIESPLTPYPEGDELDTRGTGKSLNLPSPTLSPTSNNRIHWANIPTTNTPLDQNSQSLAVFDRNTLLDSTALASLSKLPSIVNTFDTLPDNLKSYLLLQLLKRCPVPTLQFVSCLVLPTLRRDFLGLLPIELSHQILQYLDLRSIGRCGRVSKSWKRVVHGEVAELEIWKRRLTLEGWLNLEEVTDELRKAKRITVLSGSDDTLCNNKLKSSHSSIIEDGQPISSVSGGGISSLNGYSGDIDGVDSDEELNVYHKARKHNRKDHSEQDEALRKQVAPNLYRNLYKKHHRIRLNWFQGKCKHISFPGHGFNVVTCLQFDSDKIVSGSDDQTIHIYDTKTGVLRSKLEGHDGGVWALSYWKHILVSGSTDRTVRVWDMGTGKCTHKFDGHTSTVRCLMIVIPSLNEETGKMEPEMPMIVTGSRDSTLRVWKLPDPRKDAHFNTATAPGANGSNSPVPDDSVHNPYFLHVLNGHTQSVRAIAGHGNVLVSGSYDHTVRVWDLNNGVNVFCFRGHTEKVYSVGYSHELRRAASGSMDATVRVWCTRTGVCLHVLKEGHSSLVGLLEFSATYLVSAAADATLRVWSPTTGKCLATLTGHAAAITCFHHDPKYNRIVSGSDGGVKVWELSSTGYGSHIMPPATAGGPGFAFTQGPNGPEPVHGRFIGDVVKGVQGVWRTRMDEQRLVCAVQKEGGRTHFEVLDFGADVDEDACADETSQVPNEEEEAISDDIPAADLLGEDVEGQESHVGVALPRFQRLRRNQSASRRLNLDFDASQYDQPTRDGIRRFRFRRGLPVESSLFVDDDGRNEDAFEHPRGTNDDEEDPLDDERDVIGGSMAQDE